MNKTEITFPLPEGYELDNGIQPRIGKEDELAAVFSGTGFVIKTLTGYGNVKNYIVRKELNLVRGKVYQFANEPDYENCIYAELGKMTDGFYTNDMGHKFDFCRPIPKELLGGE